MSKDSAKLPDPNTHLLLQPVCATLDEVCRDSGKATPETVARVLGYPRLAGAAKWLIGEWLEDWALEAILANANEFGIEHFGKGLKPEPRSSEKVESPHNFDLDVAAMIGYQLFAISCIASAGESKKNEIKEAANQQKTRKKQKRRERSEVKKHLFEVYVRARQLGGDEARVAVVSCMDTPESLQSEVERDWHVEGQIRVFGRHHLTHLADAFREWFKTATKI